MIDKHKLKHLGDVKQVFIHKVEKGENVFTLAETFHTTVECIIKNNALTEDVKYGQYLVIEKLDGEEYIVLPKDTILKIAGNDKEKALQIISKNKIDYIFVGQKLYL